jgi:Pro-kumamolisin, activation domain
MTSKPGNYRRLAGSELIPSPDARLVGLADADEAVTVRVFLRPRPDGSPLPGHEHWVATPPGRRTFLSLDELAARHGAAPEDLDAIAGFARTHGLKVTQTSVAGRTVVLSGTAAQVGRAFAVELGRYESPRGPYRGHEGFVGLPEELADVVLAVFGLDNRRAGGRNSPGDPPGYAIFAGGPPQVAQLYDFPAPPPGITAQSIGVVEFGGGWTQGDIDATFGGWFAPGTPPTPTDVSVTASNNPGVNPGADGEVMLDICTASSVAPGAQIRVYWGSSSLSVSDWQAVLNAIINDADRPSVVTTSIFLSNGDDSTTLGFNGVSQSQVKALSSQFQTLAALGVTVLAACGDDGARSLTRDGLRHVQYPGSDPWVTSCGGTSISTSPDYVEWVWNDIFNDPENGPTPQATGGGVSACFTGSLPAWQQVVSVPVSLNDGSVGRGVPDVAGNASLNSGYMLTVDSESTGPLGGTSAVAPLYAGLMAIVNANLSQPVGFLNPTLYAFRDTVCRDINDQAYAGSPQDNGIQAFTNAIGDPLPAVGGYPSTAGWDACTGLGVIDGNALVSALQAVYRQDCQFIVDRTEIGEAEVSATLSGSTPGVIANACYVVVDGFSAADLSISAGDLSGPPSVHPAFTSSVAGLSVTATALLAEDVSLPATPQRFTWVCAIDFDTSLSAFSDVTASTPVLVTLTASIASVSASGAIELVAEADPYELDGPVSWLSTDLRVFQMPTGGSLAGLSAVALGDTGNPRVDAPDFIQNVISGFNADPTPPPGHPFDQISTDEQVSEVTLNQLDAANQPIYNFAVARVRYQSAVASSKVRVFFRIFQAATTSTAYEPATYATVANTTVSQSGKIPVFGVNASGDVVAIPCFASARVAVDSSLSTQADDSNVVLNGIQPAAEGGVTYTYFGCWLDINQPTTNAVPLAPVPADSALPWANGAQPVLAAIRGQHQCLVSEISYDADPVQTGDTPASSDKLAQRNLAIVPSSNPGNPASHRIPMTFDVRPTPRALPPDVRPDELMIDWGNTPAGSTATVYLPGTTAAEVLDLAAEMYVNHQLSEVAEDTIGCPASGVTWIPVPPGAGDNFAGLLTVDLPRTVRKGQAYTIVVRQVTSFTSSVIDRAAGAEDTAVRPGAVGVVAERRVLGAFQLTVPVKTEEALLEPEERLLAIMRWIGEGIAPGDRWSPVFGRYLTQIADRVEGFGGDPAQIPPSATGSIPPSGRHVPRPHEVATTGKVTGLVYDRFGGFEGFLLTTDAGPERFFESTEPEVESLAGWAWAERIVVTVFAERRHPRVPASIVLRRLPWH